jgi:hypothetical protein
MRILRWVAGSSVILPGVAGCAGFTPAAIGAARIAEHAPPDRYTRSWVAPDAKAQTLLYVSSFTNAPHGGSDVDIFTYPRGKLKGALTGFEDPGGLCVDKSGDVFVAEQAYNEIFEYPHGSAQPIAVLQDAPYSGPADCSIDPTTGNLAVANVGVANYGIAIYQKAHGTPTIYKYSNYWAYFHCGYDDSGNLFVGSLDGNWHFMLLKMRKGSTDFVKLTLRKLPYEFEYTGGVKWDGRNVAIDDEYRSTIYQVEVKGSVGTVVGSTRLAYGNDSGAFWFPGLKFGERGREAKRVIATGVGVGYWNYPGGGTPTNSVPVGGPHGVAVSRESR